MRHYLSSWGVSLGNCKGDGVIQGRRPVFDLSRSGGVWGVRGGGGGGGRLSESGG